MLSYCLQRKSKWKKVKVNGRIAGLIGIFHIVPTLSDLGLYLCESLLRKSPKIRSHQGKKGTKIFQSMEATDLVLLPNGHGVTKYSCHKQTEFIAFRVIITAEFSALHITVHLK